MKIEKTSLARATVEWDKAICFAPGFICAELLN